MRIRRAENLKFEPEPPPRAGNLPAIPGSIPYQQDQRDKQEYPGMIFKFPVIHKHYQEGKNASQGEKATCLFRKKNHPCTFQAYMLEEL